MGDIVPTATEGATQPDSPWTTPEQRALYRGRLTALLLALPCAVAAILAIKGPADAQNTSVEWPAAKYEMLGPAPVGTPFLLTEREAASMTITSSCSVWSEPDQVGREGRDELVILATARAPLEVYGLEVTYRDDRIRVRVSTDTLVTLDVPATPEPECELSMWFGNGRWTATLAGQAVGGAHEMPAMSGLYTDYPDDGPQVRFATIAQDSSPSSEQWWWTAVAALFGLLASAQVIRIERQVAAGAPVERVRSRWRVWRIHDVVVVVVSVLWWIASSTLSDDGWVMTTVLNRRSSGTFSNYYDAYNGALPLSFLHDGLLWLIAGVSDSLLALRLPALVVAIGGWLLLTRIYDDAVEGTPLQASRQIRAVLLVTYLLSFMTAAMTLRPEPLVIVLLLVVLRSVQRFLARPSVLGLFVPVVAAGLAISIHTTGIVTLAPLVVALPTAWRMLRGADDGELWTTTAIALLAGTAMAMLMFADSDFALWSHNRMLTTFTHVHDGGITTEWQRYRYLFRVNWGRPPLRMTFLLSATVTLISLLRSWRRRRAGAPTDFNRWAAMWLVGVALLATVPSKWPNHLIALTGLSSLAVAVELATWRRDVRAGSRANAVRRVLAVGGLAAGVIVGSTLIRIGTWSWTQFSITDFTANAAFSKWVALAWGVGALVAVLAGVVGPPRFRALVADGRLAVSLMASVAVTGVIGLLGLYTWDNVTTKVDWTVARQSLGVEAGSCGLAGVLTAFDPRSGRELDEAKGVTSTGRKAGAGSIPVADEGFGSSYRIESEASGVALPWQVLDRNPESAYAFWIAGQGDNSTLGEVHVEFGRADGDRVEVVGTLEDTSLLRFAWVRVDRWMSQVFRRPPGIEGADRIRLVLDSSSGEAFEVSPITVLTGVPAERRVRDRVVATHVDLRPLIPCTHEAAASRGLMEIPDAMLVPETNAPNGLLLFGTSTFHMLSDSFEFPFNTIPLFPPRSSSVDEDQMASVALAVVDRSRLAPYQPTDAEPKTEGEATGG